MSVWRQLTRGVRRLANGRAADQDVADEVGYFFDQLVAEFVAKGLSPEAARRAARLECGSDAALRENVRSYGWENVVSTLLTDLRYAARRLRGSPGFTIVAVLTLALGIGSSTAIFSAVNPILFAPLPYPEGDRVCLVLEQGLRTLGTFGMYRTLDEKSHSFAALAVTRRWQPTIAGSDRPERFDGQRVTPGYFKVLGVPPAVGRDFAPIDDSVGGAKVVIISDALWRRRFGADRGIVGRAIRLDDTLYTVIGVMPPGFENVLAPTASLWTTLQYDPALPADGREWGHHLMTIARLAPGVGPAEATRDVHSIGRAMIAEWRPNSYDPNTQFSVVRLHDDLVSGVKPALLAIMGAVLLVLVIACVNVTNLLLARGAQRRGEFALRAALGAGRGRLVRQLLTESLLLSTVGGLLGMAIAIVGVQALVAVTPAGVPRADAIRVDAAVLGFCLIVSTLVGAAFGAIPALQAAKQDPQRDLQQASQRTAGGHHRTRRVLVVAEVALALVLLVSTGLLLRSLNRLFAQPAGFSSGGLLTLQVNLVGHRYDGSAATFHFFDRALEAIRRVPGIEAAGFTSQLPLSGDRDEYGARFEAAQGQPEQTRGVFRYATSDGYLEAAGIPLLRGRSIEKTDRAGTPMVAVISEALAKGRFQDRDPLGQRLRIGPAGPYTIVGVVGDVRQLSLALSESEAVYLNAAQSWFPDHVMSLAVRGKGDPRMLVEAIEHAVWSIDKDQPIVRIAMMDDVLARSAAERRFALVVFEAFGIAALVLAAIGIYGILSGSVTERVREIGVRAALGASRVDIVSLIVKQGMALTGFGIAIGLAGAVAASGAVVTLLFGVSRLDVVTYAGVVGVLLAASGVACWLPAWRAARIDPAITLRAE
jgi:putative ABC transport system permease protein